MLESGQAASTHPCVRVCIYVPCICVCPRVLRAVRMIQRQLTVPNFHCSDTVQTNGACARASTLTRACAPLISFFPSFHSSIQVWRGGKGRVLNLLVTLGRCPQAWSELKVERVDDIFGLVRASAVNSRREREKKEALKCRCSKIFRLTGESNDHTQ